MATLNLTRRETVVYEDFGSKIGNWQLLSELHPVNSECENIFDSTDSEFQTIADAVDTAFQNEDEIFGIDENNELKTVIPIPDRKPPGRPPGNL